MISSAKDPRSVRTDSHGHTAAVGLDPALSRVTGLQHWACLQLAPPAVPLSDAVSLHSYAPACAESVYTSQKCVSADRTPQLLVVQGLARSVSGQQHGAPLELVSLNDLGPSPITSLHGSMSLVRACSHRRVCLQSSAPTVDAGYCCLLWSPPLCVHLHPSLPLPRTLQSSVYTLPLPAQASNYWTEKDG